MSSPTTNRRVVLLVDDAVDSIRLLNEVLEMAGMTVLVALEGAQALTIASNITPDIILMDAIMPNMDGFETCRRLKQNPGLAAVPVIFMTGLSDTEHVLMGLGAGGVDYVTKPVNPQELVARMEVHLTTARMTRSARMALDTTGQYLFAVDRSGGVLWATPQVNQLLSEAGAGGEHLHAQLRDWLARSPESGHSITFDVPDQPLKVEFLARIDARESLLRLSAVRPSQFATQALQQQFGLTAREADVLLWIAHGKTNREVGQILETSPRTVNKHLEQVFRKLGVENRTSAAAAAIRCLSHD